MSSEGETSFSTAEEPLKKMSALPTDWNKDIEEDAANESLQSESTSTLDEQTKYANTDNPSNSKKKYCFDDTEPTTTEKKLKSESSVSTNIPTDLSVNENVTKDSSSTNDNLGSIIAEHYNLLQEKGLEYRNQSRIIHMRNFNNWIKNMLINEHLEKIRQNKSHGERINVLDMCCGKGGDLLKWRKANISHLICADIAEKSVEQCCIRFNDMWKPNKPRFAVEFYALDCTKARLREKYRDPSLQLDMVSCQFALHYSFETLPQAECMLRNASESLRPGGFFIGTMPDANELVSRWQKADGNKFGNDVYSVEFKIDDKKHPPLFGAKYIFHLEGVVDCPEFLVHLPTLCKLALKFGLELVMFERFEKFYERVKEEGKTLLARMQALETYPPYHDAPLFGENSEYQHAVEYMQNSSGHRKIGTLSRSEWEATSIYAVFAFRKMKSVWNAEGKQEYIKS